MDFDKLDSNPEFKSVHSNSETAKSYIKRSVSKWQNLETTLQMCSRNVNALWP